MFFVHQAVCASGPRSHWGIRTHSIIIHTPSPTDPRPIPPFAFSLLPTEQPCLPAPSSPHTPVSVCKYFLALLQPTFIFYKDGKRLEAFSGAQRDLLITLVNKHK